MWLKKKGRTKGIKRESDIIPIRTKCIKPVYRVGRLSTRLSLELPVKLGEAQLVIRLVAHSVSYL